MGLGKTVQCLAMILKHKRLMDGDGRSGDVLLEDKTLKRSDATLIIAPESIVAQWVSEITMHAPSLRTFEYHGLATGFAKKRAGSEEELLNRILKSDIVIASYQTIAREIHFAETPPDRSMRHERKYERRRSPLVQVQWWRCILDECQMVESGVSNAARVANQIPRKLAWAVSGTPLRKDTGDLFGLLVFLRLAPYCWSAKLWNSLLNYHKPIFIRLCGSIVLRHTKDLVKDDIQLPPQKRIIVTIPFTQIEEQHYSNLFEIMCHKVGLDTDGAPLHEDWDPSDPSLIETMRSWLTQLRQICLHPQVGERNRRALGQTEGTLKTIDEVLHVMDTQNDTELHNQERAYLTTHLRRGQLLENARRSTDALSVWQEALPKIKKVVEAAREALDHAAQTSKNAAADAVSNVQLGPLSNRLRLILEIEHMATFFIGNAYFQIKSDETLTEPESDDFKKLEESETASYDAAKALRREILKESLLAVETLVESIKPRLYNTIPRVPELDVTGGIETRGVLDRIEELSYRLDEQAAQLETWKAALAALLTKTLVDREEQEITGDEYETSMKQQDEVRKTLLNLEHYIACNELCKAYEVLPKHSCQSAQGTL